MLKRKLFIKTKHNMRTVAVLWGGGGGSLFLGDYIYRPFMKLQNDT